MAVNMHSKQSTSALVLRLLNNDKRQASHRPSNLGKRPPKQRGNNLVSHVARLLLQHTISIPRCLGLQLTIPLSNGASFQKSCQRMLHITPSCQKVQAGRYKITPKGDRPLTYEMANPPHFIAHRKAWNSWNTSNVEGGLRSAETAVEDIFIRRFMTGTWHSLFASEIIIKRQHNIIRVAGLVRRAISTRKMYFLIGYCEELLGSWLQCPVKLEIQTIDDKKDVIFKYV